MGPNTLSFGAIAGPIFGVLGGIIGTYCSIKNTAGPRERAFMIRSAIICWILVIAFLVGIWLIPSPQRHLLWLPYAVILPLAIIYGNRRQGQIRQEESIRQG